MRHCTLLSWQNITCPGHLDGVLSSMQTQLGFADFVKIMIIITKFVKLCWPQLARTLNSHFWNHWVPSSGCWSLLHHISNFHTVLLIQLLVIIHNPDPALDDPRGAIPGPRPVCTCAQRAVIHPVQCDLLSTCTQPGLPFSHRTQDTPVLNPFSCWATGACEVAPLISGRKTKQ